MPGVWKTSISKIICALYQPAHRGLLSELHVFEKVHPALSASNSRPTISILAVLQNLQTFELQASSCFSILELNTTSLSLRPSLTTRVAAQLAAVGRARPDDEEGTLGPATTIVNAPPPVPRRPRAQLPPAHHPPPRPRTIITTRRPLGPSSLLTALKLAPTPVTPAHRYAGWVAAPVAPSRSSSTSRSTRATSTSGCAISRRASPGASSTRSSRATHPCSSRRSLRRVILGRGEGRPARAIKNVALILDYDDEEGGVGQKLVHLRRELEVLRGLQCEQMDGCNDKLVWAVELVFLALIVMGLVAAGGREYCAMLQALGFLYNHRIAHRDLRSDNLLLNGEGVLKLIDSSNAAQSRQAARTPCLSRTGGHCGSYDALDVDVWSVGATVWEIAEVRPPFSDTERPTHLIQRARRRPVIVQCSRGARPSSTRCRTVSPL
ncbi:hypothetical protein C8J57DRAFT_1468164 [Mycena rebaudengoi]|nr:hypothetical protein C8J57DRAFT_1468164 [Mycena rebaudengoi]